MTVDPARLLQMLEPAVRPGATPGAGQQAGKPAFENSTFQQLLAQAGQDEQTATDSADETQTSSRALEALSGLGQIENATLRRALAKGADNGSGSDI